MEKQHSLTDTSSLRAPGGVGKPSKLKQRCVESVSDRFSEDAFRDLSTPLDEEHSWLGPRVPL